MALTPDALTALARQFQANASGLRHYVDEFEKFIDRFADLELDAEDIDPAVLMLARDLLVNHRYAWEAYRDQLLTLSERMAEIEAENPIVVTEAEWARLQAAPQAPARKPKRVLLLPEIDTHAVVPQSYRQAPVALAGIVAAALIVGAAILLPWLLQSR